MKVNNSPQSVPQSPTGVGREQRMEVVQTTLDNRNVGLGQANSSQLAANRSYGASMVGDIDALQGMTGSSFPGPSGMQAFAPVSDMMSCCSGQGEQGIDQILNEIQMRNQMLMMLMMQAQMDQMMMLLLMFLLMAQGAGGPPKGPVPDEHSDHDDGVSETDGPGELDGPHSDHDHHEQKKMTPERAARVLLDNMDILDTAAGIGKRDSIIGLKDLKAALENPGLPPELKEAVQYVLDNPAVMNALDIAAGNGGFDKKIGRKDLEEFLKRNETQEDEESVVPTPPGPDPNPVPAPPVPAPVPPPAPEDNAKKIEAQRNATRVHEAANGVGTSESALIQVLTSLDNGQMQALKAAYKEMYGQSLESVIKSETSGDFEKALLGLTRPRPSESEPVSKPQVASDARALKDAMRGVGTDESALIRILTSRSKAHLGELKTFYQKNFGQSLVGHVRSETSGDFRRTLLAVLA